MIHNSCSYSLIVCSFHCLCMQTGMLIEHTTYSHSSLLMCMLIKHDLSVYKFGGSTEPKSYIIPLTIVNAYWTHNLLILSNVHVIYLFSKSGTKVWSGHIIIIPLTIITTLVSTVGFMWYESYLWLTNKKYWIWEPPCCSDKWLYLFLYGVNNNRVFVLQSMFRCTCACILWLKMVDMQVTQLPGRRYLYHLKP